MIRRDSTEAELDAFQTVAERLGGFEPMINAEWLDGAFTALLAGPSVPGGAVEVMPQLVGDVWARAFGDPEDVQQASDALEARWRVLRSQLDPDLLWEDPDRLQLAALLLSPDEEGAFPLGIEWAAGFRAVAEDPQWGWGATVEPETVAAMLGPVLALLLDDEALAKWTSEHYAAAPTREQLVDDASFAVQDLRLWWIENAPRTAPRRAEALPGRNDPCFCGSGLKFKKCHGAG